MEENIISDENLLKFFSKETIEEMATLFSNGNFTELINKFFYLPITTETVASLNIADVTTTSMAYLEQIQSIDTNSALQINNNPNQVISAAMINSTINGPSFPIMSPSPQASMSQVTREFNYSLFEELNEDELSQQILLTIVLYCLLKRKKLEDEAKNLIEKYNYPHCDMIFPLILLKIKFLIKNKNMSKAIDLLNEAIFLYEDYKTNLEEKKNDLKNIYTIETFHQRFKYFNNLFNYLFCMNNLDAKIKKLYFELKLCLYSLKFYSQSYKIILDLYEKYPNDVAIQFEAAKDSVILSKPEKYKEIIEEMIRKRDEQNDSNIIQIYNNYIIYAVALKNIAVCEYDEATTLFQQILVNDQNNILLKNNIAIMDIYKNNPRDCYDKLIEICPDKKNESFNEYIKNTIKSVQDKFNIKSK